MERLISFKNNFYYVKNFVVKIKYFYDYMEYTKRLKITNLKQFN